MIPASIDMCAKESHDTPVCFARQNDKDIELSIFALIKFQIWTHVQLNLLSPFGQRSVPEGTAYLIKS